MSVAEFYADVMIALKELGIAVADQHHAVRDRRLHPVRAGHRARLLRRRRRATLLARAARRRTRCSAHFRTGFLGKVSPVHFFWGSFDLAVTRFSGRRAPRHPGGVPHLPDAVAREAYSHEVSSAGFWPGSPGPVDYPAFYSYAYPAPEGFAAAQGETRRGVFLQGAWRIHSALRRRAHRARSGRHADGIPAEHLRRRRPIWRNGTARRWSARWARRGR